MRQSRAPEKVPFRTVVFSSKPSDQGTGTLPDSCLGCERFEVGTALSTLRVAQSDGMKLPDASVSLSRKAKLAPGWIVLRNDSQRGELGICAALSIDYRENDSSC